MEYLLGCGLLIKTFGSDRHASIAKHMREKLANIKQYFDIWHLKKSMLQIIITCNIYLFNIKNPCILASEYIRVYHVKLECCFSVCNPSEYIYTLRPDQERLKNAAHFPHCIFRRVYMYIHLDYKPKNSILILIPPSEVQEAGLLRSTLSCKNP